MPDGLFLVEPTFWCARNVQKTIVEFQRDSVFCFPGESVTRIEDNESRQPCHANRRAQGIAGEFGTSEAQYLESEVEEETFEPVCKRRAAFEQNNARKMAMTCVSFLRSNRNFVYGGGSKFVFGLSCDLRRRDVFLNHPRAHRSVRRSVNPNEAARRPVTGVGIEKQGHMRLEFNGTDFIHFQSSGRLFHQGIDVAAMADVQRPDLRLTSGVFYEIGAAQYEGCPVKPDDPGMEFS